MRPARSIRERTSKGFCFTPSNLRILTIGHSTHPAETFLGMLRAHRVTRLADVRTVPQSRRHPHFGKDALAGWLAPAGIAYRHFPGLGGLRTPRSNSVNTAWQHPGFRGYADYMETPAFVDAVEALEAFATAGTTVVMCAEAVWWRCHRKLLADTLLVRGVEVRHILSVAEPKPHELSEFARPTGHGVIYPGLL